MPFSRFSETDLRGPMPRRAGDDGSRQSFAAPSGAGGSSTTSGAAASPRGRSARSAAGRPAKVAWFAGIATRRPWAWRPRLLIPISVALVTLDGLNATAVFAGVGLAYIGTALYFRYPFRSSR